MPGSSQAAVLGEARESLLLGPSPWHVPLGQPCWGGISHRDLISDPMV